MILRTVSRWCYVDRKKKQKEEKNRDDAPIERERCARGRREHAQRRMPRVSTQTERRKTIRAQRSTRPERRLDLIGRRAEIFVAFAAIQHGLHVHPTVLVSRSARISKRQHLPLGRAMFLPP